MITGGWLVLSGYGVLSWLFYPVALCVVWTRLARGKEDRRRYRERLGAASMTRPEGRLVWFHAASLGEARTIMTLVMRMTERDEDLNILITTGTLSSSSYLGEVMPQRVMHQFAPYDVMPAVRKFLDHWQPEVAVLIESELWPVLLSECRHRNIPSALLNARISGRSFSNWKNVRWIARSILDVFHGIHAQDMIIGQRLLDLGLSADSFEITGSLKQANPVLPCDETSLATIRESLGIRPVWLAASTHEGEDEVALKAHKALLEEYGDILLIMVPRHPERSGAILENVSAIGLSASQRSRGGMPASDHAVYLADTIGEMGIWYRVAGISFIGGSLAEVGGHNPYEPGLLGSAIMHGQHVHNFHEIYGKLQETGGAVLVRNPDDITREVKRLMDETHHKQATDAAYQICTIPSPAVDAAVGLIDALLDQSALRST